VRLKGYVAAVALLAAAVAAVAAMSVPTRGGAPIYALALMAGLIATTEAVQIRFYHRDQVDAINVMEGVLVPLVLVTSGWPLVVTCAAAVLVGDLLRRNNLLKIVFNVSQWVLAASLGSVVLHALHAGSRPSAAALGAIVATVLVMSAVNVLAMSGVFAVLSGPGTSRRAGSVALTGHVAGMGACLLIGVCLSATYRWTPWTLVVGFLLIVGMHLTGRSYAAVRADRVRLEGLQRATHALAASLEPADAIPVFLAEARIGFEVREVQLVLFGERGTTVHTCSAPGDGGDLAAYSTAAEQHDLAAALAETLYEPAHISVGGDSAAARALAASGRQRALAAPLRSGSKTIGMLLLLDRVGMEGFEAGELPIAAALARELVGFLQRVELLQAVDGERRKLADILESTSDGILSIAADGAITSWNAGLAASTGYGADEMVGTRHFGLLRPRDSAGRDVLIERWVEQIDSASGLPTELQVVSAGGQTVWLSCSYSRIPAGEDRDDVLVVVARNITQARELERLKDDFVAVVSHELRTPLVPIKGWAQTLLNRGDRLSDAQRRTAVQSILAQAQKLESLVLNILEASRIEAGRVDGDGVADVGAIVARIVEDSLASRPDRVVRLRPSAAACNVRGSAVWVERAVTNLLANAIKYSPDEEPVDVTVSVAGAEVLVSVTDRGPGIAADAQERIFERFERLEESRKQTGTGLGLYITRRLARAMGGEVSVSSMPGAGSTFVLRLPMAPVGTAASTGLGSGSASGSGSGSGSASGSGSGSAGGSTAMPEQRTTNLRAVNVVNLR
jgi:PAS domain S-box-containing protein